MPVIELAKKLFCTLSLYFTFLKGGIFMKKYIITVNGKRYEVEVEEVNQGGMQTVAQSVSASVVTPVQPKEEPKPQKSVSEAKPEPSKEVVTKPVPKGAQVVEAPMPGTILDIKVKEGDTVTEGQVLLILEAMKMENEIVAPRSGKVTAVNAAKGASVNAGDALISLE